ncbi:major histocompatibility complex class I-related gene protein-like [Leuresthes tenuis]|uniref:major histocompatibility complex class I-related gene protein-like n=1 Tax=Leuresthes tenuis TaxID=355514 RepID=UPI003B511031
MMKGIITLLLLCHAATAMKYNMEIDHLLCTGSPNVPEYAVMADVEGVLVFYTEVNATTAKVRHDWMRELIKENKNVWELFKQHCLDYRHILKDETDSFNKDTGQAEDAPIIQQIAGCDWDNETDKVNGYVVVGVNGEDFISFDMDTKTWIISDAKAEAIKKQMDADEVRNALLKLYLTTECPMGLKTLLTYGKSYLTRKDPPSVSLLQRTPSSPVTCHATGFYPNRALLFWRRDGEEIHEGVEHGEILLNHDESFQMSVHLNVSSISAEDWKRYDCVFQFSDVGNNITTRLDKEVIRTNRVSPSEFPSGAVIGAVVGLLLLLLCITGFFIWRKNNHDTSCVSTPSSSNCVFVFCRKQQL